MFFFLQFCACFFVFVEDFFYLRLCTVLFFPAVTCSFLLTVLSIFFFAFLNFFSHCSFFTCPCPCFAPPPASTDLVETHISGAATRGCRDQLPWPVGGHAAAGGGGGVRLGLGRAGPVRGAAVRVGAAAAAGRPRVGLHGLVPGRAVALGGATAYRFGSCQKILLFVLRFDAFFFNSL